MGYESSASALQAVMLFGITSPQEAPLAPLASIRANGRRHYTSDLPLPKKKLDTLNSPPRPSGIGMTFPAGTLPQSRL